MALKIGKNDRFERLYMAKFRALSANHGEFIEYQRDRAGRDIGLHFVSERADGGETVDPSLVWFQMKGIQATSFSENDFNICRDLAIVLQVEHLCFWYIAPDPTFLVVYVEAVEEFFILNVQKYIQDRFADRIFELEQKTLTIHVTKDSILDDHTFQLIKTQCSLSLWRSRIAEGETWGNVFFRDAEVVGRLETARQRNVSMYCVLRKYGSKMRSEAYFIERSGEKNEAEEVIREHWQYMMGDDISRIFPYIQFDPLEEEEYDDECEWPPLVLPNGKEVVPCGVFELVEYKMLVSLNDIGEAWAQTLDVMESAGFIELNAVDGTMVSVAPWHHREI